MSMTKPLNAEATTNLAASSASVSASISAPMSAAVANDLGSLLENYRRSAVHVLASHLCVGSTCGSCGQPWPCGAACAAELALEL